MIEIVGLWSQGDGLPRGVMGGMTVPSLQGQALGSRDHSLCLVMYVTLTRLVFFPLSVRPPFGCRIRPILLIIVTVLFWTLQRDSLSARATFTVE